MSVAHYVTLPFKWQFKVFLTSFWQFRTRFWQFSDGLAFRLNWPNQMYARTVNMELYTFNCSCISIGQLKWNFQWGEKTPTTFWNAFLSDTNIRFILFCYTSGKKGSFDKHDFELLAPVLDGFSLMTYDYSSHGRYSSKYRFCLLTSFHLVILAMRVSLFITL